MLKIRYHTKFKKDYKRIQQRNYDIEKLKEVISMLQNEVKLPEQYRDHALIGQYKGKRECHISPDWLLIYEVNKEELILFLLRTGSHSDLFWVQVKDYE